MAKRIGLDKFIMNLKSYRDNPFFTYKDAIMKIIYALLWQMAKHTIADTNHAKYLIISQFAEKYGMTYDDVQDEYYNYWNNLELEGRAWGDRDGKTSFSEQTTGKGYKLDLTIRDDGLYNQAIGNPKYPSDKVIGRDNSHYVLDHINYVEGLFRNENYGGIEKLNMDKIINDLVKNIENNLFK